VGERLQLFATAFDLEGSVVNEIVEWAGSAVTVSPTTFQVAAAPAPPA